MALPINIEDLLQQRKVESNRIEFKKGWNPEKIYRSICGFANDFDNIGGGYILVGVEEENGIAKRPVSGLDTEQIDSILRDMNNYNNKLNPYYLPRTEIDDDRLSFLVRIPCHEGEEGIPNLAIGTHIIPKETVEIPKETGENPKETEEIPKENELSGLQLDILRIIKKNPAITLQSLSLQLGVTIDKIRYQRTQLEKKGIFLCRKGATKKGTWEIKFD